MPVDLRSDTVTRPTPGMREAMANAEVGDDVYGEDPTVNALEAEVAALLGHEAALFVPTGSMGNQLGIRLLVGPGQELVIDPLAHVARAELGAAAVFSGITFRTWRLTGGRLDPDAVAELIHPNAGPHLVSTAAIAIENTHNFGSGAVQSAAAVAAVRDLAREHGLGLHLDGARLWNAHVATGVPLAELAAGFDTVSVCLSKGLGAPVGSVLVSSADRIAEARVWRKRYGGGMRQVGILAAAGRYALAHHIERLADDHARARRLASALEVDPAGVDTNIVVVETDDAPAIAAKAADDGVLISALGPRVLRLVTHLDLDDAAIDRAVDVLRPLVHARGTTEADAGSLAGFRCAGEVGNSGLNLEPAAPPPSRIRHKYGNGPFAKLTMPALPKEPGLYAWEVDGAVMYIGQTSKPLASRLGSNGYATIAMYNTLAKEKGKSNGGQQTNCRINNLANAVLSGGGTIRIWVRTLPAQEAKLEEARWMKRHGQPEWNAKLEQAPQSS